MDPTKTITDPSSTVTRPTRNVTDPTINVTRTNRIDVLKVDGAYISGTFDTNSKPPTCQSLIKSARRQSRSSSRGLTLPG